MLTSNKSTGKHAPWSLILQEYDLEIVHRAGLKHANADVCSRHPLPTTVNNGACRDHDEGDGTLNECVMAALAHVDFSAGQNGQERAMAGEPREDVAGAKLWGPPDIWADQNCVVHKVSGEMPKGLSM